MSDNQMQADGWERHRREQILMWGKATPAQRFAWLEEMLDWMRSPTGLSDATPRTR